MSAKWIPLVMKAHRYFTITIYPYKANNFVKNITYWKSWWWPMSKYIGLKRNSSEPNFISWFINGIFVTSTEDALLHDSCYITCSSKLANNSGDLAETQPVDVFVENSFLRVGRATFYSCVAERSREGISGLRIIDIWNFHVSASNTRR